jgi:phage-related protein
VAAGQAESIELGVAYISVVAETDKLARGVRDALREAQRYVTAHPINIKANVDVSHIGAIQIPVTAKVNKAQLRREVRDVDNLFASVQLKITSAEVNRFATELNAKLRAKRFLVYLIPVVDEDALRDRLRHLPDGTIKLKLEVSSTEMNRFISDLRRRLREADFTIPVRMDLSNEAAFRANLEALTRNRTVNVDVNGRGLDRLKSATSLGGVTVSSAALSAVAAGLAVIGGAAGAALGAVGALGVGIAALGPAAAAAGATVAVGIQGIGDAFKTLSAAEESAGTDGAAQAKAIAAAQEQVVSAHEQVASALDGVTSAQQTLTDAQKDAESASRDVADAYKQAADDLEDYQFKLRDTALDQKEAALALKEAQKDVFEAKTPAAREKALLRVERAQLNYDKSVESGKDLQDEANQAQAKGIEGSDKVVAAKEKAAAADRRVADAQKGVEKANQQVEKAQRQVEKAQQALTEATNKTSAAQDKAAQALAKLSPEARAWVLAVRDMAPAWADLRTAVQDSLFDDAASGIRDLASVGLPVLKAGMVDVAASMNGLTKQFAGFWAAPQNLDGVRSAFAGTRSFIDGLGPGLQQATTGFLSLGKAFEPVANQVGAQLANMLGNIGQAFTDAFDSGALTQLVSTFGDILQGLGEGLNPLIAGLIEMGNIVGPTLGPFFKQFGESIKNLAPSFGALGATFMDTLTTLLPPLDQFLAALATGLRPVLPVVGKLLESLFTALTPLIGPMSEIAQVVGIALSDALIALEPAIGPLGQAFAALVTAVAPLLPVFAEIVAGLVQALAPALTTIFQALGPVITQWAELMMPVFREIQPILADVANKIAVALVGALNQLAPYLPDIAKSFGNLILAIAPLLPQLVEIAVSVLPPLLELFIAILPQLLKLTDAFTWLVNNVITPLVIPALKLMTGSFTSSMSASASAVTTAKDTIGGAIKSMGEFFSNLGATVSNVWDGIVKSIARNVKKVGELLLKVPNVHIPGTSITIGGDFQVAGNALVSWATSQGAAMGGLATGAGVARPVGGGRQVRGPGTGTSDSILAMLGGNPIALSNKEFISTEQAYKNGAPLLWALNQGWVPSPEFLSMLVGGGIPGFAEGGVPGKKFAESMDPVPYLMGGYSRASIDCSGMVAAVVNDALGLDPFSGRMSTVNEGSWLANKGALPGLGGPGDISIGWYDRGGGANGHTALTLGDGTNVESNGSEGVVIGGPVGASASMFDQHMHIPADLLRGGDLGGPATGAGATKGGRSSKLGAAPGGGGGASGSGASGGGASGGAAGTLGDNAQRVFVVNWPGTAIDPSGSSTTSPGSTATPTIDSSVATPTVLTDTVQPGRWWEAATPEQGAAQLGANLATVDVPGRVGNALADFGNSTLQGFIGDLGGRTSGGALQELVKVIQNQMAAEVAEQMRRSRAQATSFVGRR